MQVCQGDSAKSVLTSSEYELTVIGMFALKQHESLAFVEGIFVLLYRSGVCLDIVTIENHITVATGLFEVIFVDRMVR